MQLPHNIRYLIPHRTQLPNDASLDFIHFLFSFLCHIPDTFLKFSMNTNPSFVQYRTKEIVYDYAFVQNSMS